MTSIRYQFSQEILQTQQTLPWDSHYEKMPVKYSSQQTPVFTLIEKPRIFNGYTHGYRQPVALIKLQIDFFNTIQIQHLQNALAYYFNLQINDCLITCLG